MTNYKVKFNCVSKIDDDDSSISPPPPPQCSPDYNNKISKKKYPTRKEREYFEKEEKFKHLMSNTIILTPDSIFKIRKKIIIKGIQIDVESFLLGNILGALLFYFIMLF